MLAESTESSSGLFKEGRLKKGVEEESVGYHLTSYAVFDSFITRSGEGNEAIDVSRVFTRACFELWLKTRRGGIQHPEHSFQRALYAHIRGADGRKPFPEDIEKEILQTLRNWTENDGENPWDNVFDSNRLNVGLKGFRSMGYHERKACEAKPGSNVKQIKKRTRRKKNTKEAAKKSKGLDIPSTPVVEVPQPYIPPLPRSELEDVNALKSMFPVDPNDLLSANPFQVQEYHGGPSPWQAFLSASKIYLDHGARKEFLRAAVRRGVPLNSPSLIFLLSQPPSPSDIRFQWDFLMPPIEERRFRDDKPLAMLLYNPQWTCIAENQAAVDVFKGSSLGWHVLEKNNSVICSLYCNIKFIPEYYGNGVAWCRLPMNKADGSIGVFLSKCVMRENGQCVDYLQEQSDMFPPELTRPGFFL